MSRFFDESSQSKTQCGPLTQEPAKPAIDELLRSVRDAEEQQVASVANPISGTIAARELEHLLRSEPSASASAVDSSRVCAPGPERIRVSLPQFVGRIGGSDNMVMRRAAEVLRTVRTRLLRVQAGQGFRSVVITSAGAHEGKTLICANLALCCAQLQNFSVLLIDADLRTAGLSKLLQLPLAVGLNNLLAGSAPYEEAVLSTDVPGVDVIAAGKSVAPAPELLASNKWRELIARASKQYRLVIIDSPPVLPVADFELISAGCEKVITVAWARRTKRAQLEQALKLIDPHKRLGMLLNGSDRMQPRGYDNYAYYGYGDSPMIDAKPEGKAQA